MNKRTLVAGLAVLLAVLLLARAAGAQPPASYSLWWHVLAGGAGRSGGTHYAMDSTLGQSIVGSSESGQYGMRSGYGQVWRDELLYLPLITKAYA